MSTEIKTKTTESNKLVLCAFEIEGSNRRFNVWRYGGGATVCVLFSFKAESREAAIRAAEAKIELKTLNHEENE